MRCAFASITIVLLAVAGCRNQASSLTNPFLTPDRVPPPSTRGLAPGTSQPVYAGDPLPGSTFGAPGSTTFAPGATTFAPPTTIGTPQVMPPTSYPAGAYPSGPLTPAPVTPTSPPSGWGGQPTAQKSTFVPGDSVQAPVDQQPLRFGTVIAATADGGAPAMRSIAADVQLPTAPGAFVSNAGALAPIQQAAYDEAPSSSAGSFGRVEIREVTPAEYLEGRQASSLGTSRGAAEAGPAGAGAKPQAGGTSLGMRDGFRPQGTTPPREAEAAQSFRTPEIRRDALDAETSTVRYGVGENQDWLRGQLEYWPETGQWSVRYMDPTGPADQIGGRVLIDNPQVLGNLPPGEFVMVRGQVFGRQIDDASYLPAYRVATVERQRGR